MPGDGVEGVLQILGNLLGLHHDEAALGERRLLAGLGLEDRQLLDRVTEEVGLLARPLDAGALLGEGRARLAHAPRRRRDGARSRPRARRRRRGWRGG